MDWKALFRPMKETAEREVKAAVDRLIRTPRPEDIASPLREELKGLMGAKQDVGYAEHCANCRGHQTLDQGVAAAVESKEDPTPYLEGIYGGIITLNENIPVLITRLEDTSEKVAPSRVGKYLLGGVISGMIGKGALDLAIWLIPKILGLG